MASSYSTSRFGLEISPDDLCSRLQQLRLDIIRAQASVATSHACATLTPPIQQLPSALIAVADAAWALRCRPSALLTEQNVAPPINLISGAHVRNDSSAVFHLRDSVEHIHHTCATICAHLVHRISISLSITLIEADWLEELEVRSRRHAHELLNDLDLHCDSLATQSSSTSSCWTELDASLPDLMGDDGSSDGSAPSSPAISPYETNGWPYLGHK